jgi:hypothetical protein
LPPNSRFTNEHKPRQEPHCIARKLNASPSSGTREYCLDPRQRLGKDALRLYRTCAQRCLPMQRILWGGLLAPFGDTRACCLLALARRCTVFSFRGRKPTRLSNIEMGGRNQDRNGYQPRDRRDGTKAGSPRHHFLLQAFSSWGTVMVSWQSRCADFVLP